MAVGLYDCALMVAVYGVQGFLYDTGIGYVCCL